MAEPRVSLRVSRCLQIASNGPRRSRIPRPQIGDLTGAFGDLGVLLPLAAGLIVVAGVDPGGFFITFGAATLLAGFAFRLPMPVQPQKAVAAAAITERWTAGQVAGASLGMGVVWLVVAATPLLTWLRRVLPEFVARGVQLALAFSLAGSGVGLLAQNIPLAGLGLLLLGVTLRHRLLGLALTLLAAIVLLPHGSAGLAFAPTVPALAIPSPREILDGFVLGGVAQIPLTLTNAIIATAALAARYFPERPVSERKLAASTGIIGVATAFVGGAALCHGAGGLAAQYFYGARTVWKNIIEAAVAISLGLFFAPSLAALLSAFPLPLLGSLLLLVALELLSAAEGLYGWRGWIASAMAIIGVTTNIGVAFFAGLGLAYLTRYGVHRGWLPRLKGKTPAEYLARFPRRVFGTARPA